ncbi:MAG: hypothetical protein QW334_03800 [Thermofilum sp.]
MRRAILGICLVLLLILTGCESASKSYGEIREEIWLTIFDVWQAKIIWVLNPSERASVLAEINPAVEQKCQSANQWGIRCQLRQQETLEGGMITVITVVGRGLEDLNLVSFDGKALLTRDENGYVLLKASPPVGGLRYYSLILHAGPIIESNANQQTSFTAIWENPSTIWVKTRNWNPVGLILVAFTVYPVVVLAGVAILIVLIVLAIVLRRRR